jgi:hypothetical protein
MSDYDPSVCAERHLMIAHRLDSIETTLHRNGLCSKVEVIASKVEGLPKLTAFVYKAMGALILLQFAVPVVVALVVKWKFN